MFDDWPDSEHGLILTFCSEPEGRESSNSWKPLEGKLLPLGCGSADGSVISIGFGEDVRLEGEELLLGRQQKAVRHMEMEVT